MCAIISSAVLKGPKPRPGPGAASRLPDRFDRRYTDRGGVHEGRIGDLSRERPVAEAAVPQLCHVCRCPKDGGRHRQPRLGAVDLREHRRRAVLHRYRDHSAGFQLGDRPAGRARVQAPVPTEHGTELLVHVHRIHPDAVLRVQPMHRLSHAAVRLVHAGVVRLFSTPRRWIAWSSICATIREGTAPYSIRSWPLCRRASTASPAGLRRL